MAISLPFAPVLDRVQMVGGSTRGMSVYGAQSMFELNSTADVKVLGNFSGGGFAVTRRTTPSGGSATYAGFLPGLTYYENIPKRPIDRNSRDDSFCHFIPSTFEAEAAALVDVTGGTLPRRIVSSAPLVETELTVSPAGGAVLYMVNWGHAEQDSNLTLKLMNTSSDPAPAFGSARLASSNEAIGWTTAQDAIEFTLALPVVADAIVLRKTDDDDAAACPCSNASLCRPVATPLGSRPEVFGFGAGAPSTWMAFDWDVVTTVVPTASDPTTIDPQLICHAHAHGVRVVAFAPGSTSGAGGSVGSDLMPLSANLTARRLWVQRAASIVASMHLDGLNFDFESPLNSTDPRREYYAAVIAETRQALRADNPSASVSVDVGWNPDNVDGRYYDLQAMAKAADFLYIMDCASRNALECDPSLCDRFAAVADGVARGVCR